MKILGLRKGDTIICTFAIKNDVANFTVGKEYVVTSHGNIIADDNVTRIKVGLLDLFSHFKFKEVHDSNGASCNLASINLSDYCKDEKEDIEVLDIKKEIELASKYTRLPFISGEKNYYVAFDYDAGRYKRYSEDKIKRVDSILLSPEDAKSLRDELNNLITC